MSETKPASWWQTIPGILTGIAAVITALGALLAILFQQGVIGGKTLSTAPAQSPQKTIPGPTPHPSGATNQRQVQVGHFVFKLLETRLEPYAADASGKPSRFALRCSIRVTDVLGISDYIDGRTIRLAVDGAELLPANGINSAVYDKQSVEIEALFVIPADAARVELLVGRSEDATGTIPIELKAASP
jgi:hypothetical protein